MGLPRIIDNQRQSLLKIVQELAAKQETVSIATGYWDLPGTELVLPSLSHCKKIRLLIGREPLIPRHHLERPEPDFPDKDFFSDLERLMFSTSFHATASEIKRLIAEGVLEVRVYKKTFFHAKAYIFGDYDSAEAAGIIGSSNFTKNGLTANAELNALEDDHRIVTYKPRTDDQEVGHLAWFDQFWNEAETWNEAFSELISTSPHGDTLFTPYEAYIKTLHELYHEELDDEEVRETKNGAITLYEFQLKNVHALMRRLRKRQVAMLADSVGLGKTFTAIEVIKQYKEDGVRVEIICPKALKEQWGKQLTTQGVHGMEPITLQNPAEIERKSNLDSIANVALFVIDESHNLKSRAGTRFRQITEWISNNQKAHVLLLTATPVNNQLSDITNQILLASRGESDILRFTTVDRKKKQTTSVDFVQAIENLTRSIKADAEEGSEIDFAQIREIMSPILRAFVVRRTRQGIEREYGGLVDETGELQHFPKVVPEVRTYAFAAEMAAHVRELQTPGIDIDHVYELSIDEIVNATQRLAHPLDQIIDVKAEGDAPDVSSPIALVYRTILLLGFIPYRWRMYQTKFYGKSREEVRALKLSGEERKGLFSQLSIYGILRTMFLKRLESSVSAIRSSLDNYDRKLSIFEKGLIKGKIISFEDIDELADILDDMQDEDQDGVELPEEHVQDDADGKRYVLDAMRADISKERELIKLLRKQLDVLNKDDAKIKAVGALLDELTKTQQAGGKVLVFSYYADTVTYLRDNIRRFAKSVTEKNSGFVSSGNRSDAVNLAGRFAPIAQQRALKEGETEITFLFSTDILSEGQNLQDCGILINYDLHWNPVRMIQRNGRVNRLGTKFPSVYIYNISPEGKLDEYLRLVNRLERKIELIRNTIGTDTPVLAEEANPIEFVDSWKDIYSDDEIARAKAMERAEEEADFLLAEDEYVLDLKKFHNDGNMPQRYKDTIYGIPRGKWSIMPTGSSRGEQRPEALSLVSLILKGESVGHTFVAFSRRGLDVQSVPHLQALEWLRARRTDEDRRPSDSITADRPKLIGCARDAALTYHEEAVATAPVGQQTEILSALFQLNFSQEDIDAVRKAFGSRNVLLREDLKKMTRRFMNAKRDNRQDVDTLNEIVRLARTATERQPAPADTPDAAEPILMYSKTND